MFTGIDLIAVMERAKGENRSREGFGRLVRWSINEQTLKRNRSRNLTLFPVICLKKHRQPLLE